MPNSDPLVPFGFAVIIIVGLFIAVPFFRGKSDLLTAWNTLLLGLIVFAGLGSLEVKYAPTVVWPSLEWFQPTAKEVQWYMWATAAFIATLLAAYYLNAPAKSFARKRLRKWPKVTAPVTFFVLGCCAVTMMMSIVFGRVTFLGPLTSNLAQVAAPAACVFSFILWFGNRRNVGWLALFLGVFACVAMYAMVVSGGRRLLLSVVVGPVLCVYWTQARYWGRPKIALAVGLAGVLIIGVSIIYAKFRYYSAVHERRTAHAIVGQLHDVGKGGYFAALMKSGPLPYFSQGSGYFALLTERYVAQGALTPVPLNSLRFLIAYPIPRKVWPRKPDILGQIITRQAAHAPGNWGLGVAGQGAYEGGIPALVLYAILLAFGIRFMDEPQQQQPGNPFLIYMQASALPHVAALTRGDMGLMTMQVGQCILFALILGIACRAIFGTERNPIQKPLTSRREEFPAYRGMPKPRLNR